MREREEREKRREREEKREREKRERENREKDTKRYKSFMVLYRNHNVTCFILADVSVLGGGGGFVIKTPKGPHRN